MRNFGIYLILLALVACAGATTTTTTTSTTTTTTTTAEPGWSEVWPAWDYQREGKAQAQDVHSALLERAYVAGVEGAVDTPAWYRSQRSLLVAWKADFLAVRAGAAWVDTNATFVGTADVPAALSVAQICTSAGLPANYFAYTPWRCLNGNGPFTNDTTVVGRGHGWTNATTAAGGTNYPAGRATWYTTDYGWHGLHDAINLLVWTRSDENDYVDYYAWTPDSLYDRVSCATAYSLYTNAWVTNPDIDDFGAGGPYEMGAYVNFDGSDYQWSGWRSGYRPVLVGLATNSPHSAEYLALPTNGPWYAYADVDGIGLTPFEFSSWESFTSAAVSSNVVTNAFFDYTYDATPWPNSTPPSDPVQDNDFTCAGTVPTNASLAITGYFLLRWAFDYK